MQRRAGCANFGLVQSLACMGNTFGTRAGDRTTRSARERSGYSSSRFWKV
jgi:hypothetical protein